MDAPAAPRLAENTEKPCREQVHKGAGLIWGRGSPTASLAMLQLGAVGGSFAGSWDGLGTVHGFLLPVTVPCQLLLPTCIQGKALEGEMRMLPLLSPAELGSLHSSSL